MTRRYVRADVNRLADVVATYYANGNNVRKTADVLQTSKANVYHLLRRAATEGLFHPKPRKARTASGTGTEREAGTGSAGTPEVTGE